MSGADYEDIDPSEVAAGISPLIREAMLDLILSWGAIDHAVSELHCLVHGLDEVESADDVGPRSAQVKLRELQLELRGAHAGLAASVGRLKKRYEKHSRLRDMIAHGRCVGRLKVQPDTAVFLRFRRAGAGLAVHIVEREAFQEAAGFGVEMLTAVLATVADFRKALNIPPGSPPPH